MKLKLAVLVLASALFGAACQQGQHVAGSTRTVTAADRGSTIQLARNDTLHVSLGPNWRLGRYPHDLLQVVHRDDRHGRYTFRVLKPGGGSVELSDVRTCGPPVNPTPPLHVVPRCPISMAGTEAPFTFRVSVGGSG